MTKHSRFSQHGAGFGPPAWFVERLEPRSLLACGVAVTGGFVRVLGDNAANDVLVQLDPGNPAEFRIDCDGTVQNITAASLRSLVIDSRGGDDAIDVRDVGAPIVRVTLGSGLNTARLDLKAPGGSAGSLVLSGGPERDDVELSLVAADASRFKVQASLGLGDDRFVGNVTNGPLGAGAAPPSVRVNVLGGAGEDSIEMNHALDEIFQGDGGDFSANYSFFLLGQAGNDFIQVLFDNADATLAALHANGGLGDDDASVQIGLARQVNLRLIGGDGDDALSVETLSDPNVVNGLMQGDAGFDICDTLTATRVRSTCEVT